MLLNSHAVLRVAFLLVSCFSDLGAGYMASGKSSRVVSYPPEQIFYPGLSYIKLLVKEGAPMTAECSLSILPHFVEKREYFIEKSGVIVRKKINFPQPGIYSVLCKFVGESSKSTYSTVILVNKKGNPVTVTSNSPVESGDTVRHSVDFGRWKDAVKVSGRGYFEPTITDGMFNAGHSTQLQTFFDVKNGVAYEQKLKKEQKGILYIRFIFDIILSEDVKEKVDVVSPVAVQTAIEKVTVKVVGSAPQYELRKDVILENGQSVSETLDIPAGKAITFSGASDEFVSSWEWRLDGEVISTNSSYNVSFPSAIKQSLAVKASNDLFKFTASFSIRPFATAENLFVLSKNAAKPKSTVEIAVVITSTMEMSGFEEESELIISSNLTVKETGEPVGNGKLSLGYHRSKKCFDATSNPMHEKLTSWRTRGLGDKKAKSYCLLEYQLEPFAQPDMYKVTVSAASEGSNLIGSVDICVTKMAECPVPMISIKKDETPSHEVRVFEIGENIHLWSELDFDKCEGYSQHQMELDYSWKVNRIQDKYAHLSDGNASRYFDVTWKPLTVNESELVLSGRSFTKGTYHIEVEVEVRPFCGDEPYVTNDFIWIRVRPGSISAAIAGGDSSLHYVTQDSMVTLQGLAYSSAGVESEQKDLVFSWFCRKESEEDNFIAFNEKNLEDPKGGGCFGHGFIVTLEDTAKRDKRRRRLAKDWPADKQVLYFNASKFHEIPGVYLFRLVMYDDAGEKSHADRQIELREGNADVINLIEVLAKDKESGQPRVEVECVSNCGKTLIPTDPLYLKAKCVDCAEDKSDVVKMSYKWLVDQPKKSSDSAAVKDSYTPSSREPQLRLRPSAFSRSGEYNISVDMIVLSKKTGKSAIISSARRRLYVTKAPLVRTCTVEPSFGIALLTKFKIGCYSQEEKGGTFFEMSYFDPSEGDRRKSRGNKEVRFHRGYKHVAQNVLLPVGDKSFGHKLTIKVKSIQQDTKRSSDAFLFAVVKPVLAEKQESLLKELLLGQESEISDLSKKKKLDNALMLIKSAISTVDEDRLQSTDVAAKVTESVLDELLSFKTTSLETAETLATALKITMDFAYGHVPQQSLEKMLNSIDKAGQMIDNLLEFLINQSDEESSKNIDGITEIGRSIVVVIFESVHSLALIEQNKAGNDTADSNSNTTSKSQELRRNLLKNFDRLMFKSSSMKTFEETPTDLSTDGISVKARKNMVRGDSLASLQPFTNIPGIRLNRASSAGNPIDEYTVRSAVSVFSKSPVPTPTNQNLTKMDINDNLPVVGISVEIEKDNETMKSTDLLHNRQVHVLIPFEQSARKSKSVNLLRPCESQKQGLSDVMMSIPTVTRENEICGSTVVKMKLGQPGAGGRRRKDVAPGSEFEESALVIRPNRPCRLPDSPCVKISLIAMTGGVANNAQDEDLRNIICTDAESREQTCHDSYTVIHSATLPRELAGSPTEFDADPWSIPISDSLLDEIQALDEDEVTIVMEHLQTDPIYAEDELDWYQNVTLDIIKPSCMVWDDYNNKWDDLSCGKAEIARDDMIHCICGSAASPFELASSTTGGSQPFFVTARLVIVPNTIDFTDVASLLLRLRSHYHALVVILFFWFVFIVPLPWAIREDKRSSRGQINIPADNDPTHSYLYEVVVFTAMLRGSGTSANVTIVLEGSNNLSSKPHVISKPDKSTLQRGGTDSFLIATDKCLGEVVRVRLRHDNSGEHPSWHVNRISVFDLHDAHRPPSYFLVNAWLSLDIYPFHCDIAVDLQPKKEFLTFKNLWLMRVAYCCSEEDVWLAPFFRTKCSPFTRVQRVACTASCLFSSMLSSIMFSDASTSAYQFQLGFVDLDLSPLIMSLETACAMAPFDILVTFIFSHIELAKGSKEKLMAALYKEAKQHEHRRSVLEQCEKGGDSPMKVLKERNKKAQNTSQDTYQDENERDSKVVKCSEEKTHDVQCRIVQTDVSSSEWNSLDEYSTSIADLTLEDGLDECREMRKIAEKIGEECKYYKSISSDPRSKKRRIHVEILTTPTVHESDIVVEQVGEEQAVQNFNRSKVWYKRFKAKRLLRRRRKSDPDAEIGDAGSMIMVPSFTSIADFADELSESESGQVDDIEGIDVGDIVVLPKLSFTLPAWIAKIVLLVILMDMLSCSFFTLLYGLSYSKDKFRRWLITFFLSLCQNIFVTTPIRISITAAVSALMGRYKINLHEWTAFTGPVARVDAVVKWRQTQMRFHKAKEGSEIYSHAIGINMIQSSKEEDKPSEPTVREEAPLLHLIKSGKRSLAVKQVKRFWLESILWISLALLVSTLIYLQRDPRLVRITQQVSDYFGSALEEVSLKEDVYSFLDESIAPTLYKDDDVDITDQFTLLGPIRVRQLRFSVHDQCHCFSTNLSRVPCACKYRDDEVGSDYYYDATSYDPFWRHSQTTSPNEEKDIISPWRYQPIEKSVGTHLLIGSILQRPYYPIGGYIVDLGYTLTQAKSTIEGLQNSGWIDSGTAAIIVEFSVLNPPTGHISAVTFIFEFLASGGMNSFTQTHSYRPIYMYSILDIAIIGMQLMHAGCTGAIVWSLLQQCARVKWKISAVLYLCADVWNALSIVIVFFTVATYSVYFKHITSGILTTRALNEDPSVFVAFSVPAYYSAAYTNLMGFVAFFTNIHLLVVMRGSRVVSVMNDTLVAAYEGIESVSVFVCAMIFGFCMTGLVSFSPYRWDFHSFVTVFSTLTSLAAGMEAPHPESRVTAEVWWSLYHLFYTLFTLVFVVNLYAAVLGDALYYIRNRNTEADSHRVETLALDWLYEKVAGYFGIRSKKFSRKRIKLREPPGPISRQISEAMRRSLMVDPAFGPQEMADESGPTHRGSIVQNERYQRRRSLEHRPSLSK